METIMNVIEAQPIILVPIGLIFVWIGLQILWDNIFRPLRINKGIATASFNGILGRTLKFIFIEDRNPAILTDKEGNAIIVEDSQGNVKPKLKYPKFGKIAIWRNFYLLGFALTIITGLLHNGASPWIFAVTCLTIATRASKVFAQRYEKLQRMFEVASVNLGYPRDANLNPWQWIRVLEWKNLTQTGEIHVHYPAKFKGGDQALQRKFETHFNDTITKDNTWVYEWKSEKSMVAVVPVPPIPTMSFYPGSAHRKWNEIPLGVTAGGEAIWDVKINPHALLTGSTGAGKAVDLDLFVLTGGGMKKIRDIKVGDTLFDPEGKPTKVTHLHPIVTPKKAYELTFSNGEKIIVDPEHLWETETRNARVSRFNNVNKENKRHRNYWFDAKITKLVENEIEKSTSTDTISISEVAHMIGKLPTAGVLHSIAREVGVAEEITPMITVHHKAQTITQNQTSIYANSQQFMESYNNRIIKKSSRFPLSKSEYDKIRQLSSEVRDTDTLTLESVLEYIGTDKHTKKWITENYNSNLAPSQAISEMYVKAETVHSKLPDKIFSIDAEYISARGFAEILGMESDSYIKQTFQRHAMKCENFKKKEVVPVIRAERVTTQKGAPYSVYPKKMFLERVLRNNSTPVNDQREKRIYPEIRTTQQILDTFMANSEKHVNHSVRRTKALEMPERDLLIAPYVLGAWLGDGYSHRGMICGLDHQVFEHCYELGYEYKQSTRDKIIKNSHEDFRIVEYPLLGKQLKEFKMSAPSGYRTRRDGEVKYIPTEYLTSSIEQRRELLRGLVDTDGGVEKNGAVQFYTSNPRLRDDAKALISSLGYIPFVTTKKTPSYTQDGKQYRSSKPSYTITFQADPADRLFHLDRKNETHRERYNHGDNHSTSELHYITDIREVEPVPMRCLSVDSPSRLFLVSESMIPTHNSTLQRNIIAHCIQFPNDWRFVGIDVKRVELSPFKQYEPVVMGVALDVPDGTEIIRYAKEEMMTRYDKMEKAGVTNFADLPEKMHALMIMVDETYMFLATSGNKTDEGKEEDALKGESSKLIGEIARLGRAAGVHIVLATQRPDATVIYGELKQNLAYRIAAGRADTIASQMTLDSDEATKLPGLKGRGYYKGLDSSGEPFQGYYAPQEWIDRWLAGDKEWLEAWKKDGGKSLNQGNDEDDTTGFFGRKLKSLSAGKPKKKLKKVKEKKVKEEKEVLSDEDTIDDSVDGEIENLNLEQEFELLEESDDMEEIRHTAVNMTVDDDDYETSTVIPKPVVVENNDSGDFDPFDPDDFSSETSQEPTPVKVSKSVTTPAVQSKDSSAKNEEDLFSLEEDDMDSFGNINGQFSIPVDENLFSGFDLPEENSTKTESVQKPEPAKQQPSGKPVQPPSTPQRPVKKTMESPVRPSKPVNGENGRVVPPKPVRSPNGNTAPNKGTSGTTVPGIRSLPPRPQRPQR